MSEYIKKEELFEKMEESGSQFFDYSEVVEMADSVPTYSFPEREKGECISVPFDFDLFQAGLMDIPKGMTNGEVIQALFPNHHITKMAYTVWVGNDDDMCFTTEWWNTPYKAESEE